MCYRELFALRQLAGGDPINFFTKGSYHKIRLQGLGKEVSKDVYLDIKLSDPTKAQEFAFIREICYHEELMSVDRLEETVNHFYVYQRSCNASGPVVSGRGAAIAKSSSDQCRRWKANGQFQRDCPQQVHKNRSKLGKKTWNNKRDGSGGSAQPKSCSYHNSTPHSDADCQKQQKVRANKKNELQVLVANRAMLHSTGQVNLPNIGSAQLA